MKNISKKLLLSLCSAIVALPALAGNKDRSGQAGATELLVNPWAASTGVFGLNVANVKGLEAMKVNIAGLAGAESTEFGVAHTIYLRGSKVSFNNLGFAQRLGDFGVLGVNIMSVNYGEITTTDYNNPMGGIGTYKPQFFNLSVGLGKTFVEDKIQAGIGLTFVSEAISNINATGACFETGVQYTSDQFHFGVALRNIGTSMRFRGQGFALNSEAPEDPTYQISRETQAEKFEMPAYLTISAAYDFFFGEKNVANEDEKPKNRITPLVTFVSNSFNNDYLGIGAEYSFRERFMVRGAYRHEKSIGDDELSTTFYTGFSAGATVTTTVGSKGPRLALDYSYRPTARPNNGVHCFSVRLLLPSKSAAPVADAEQ